MKVSIICTGGTIGSRADDSGISTRPPEENIIEQLLENKPKGYRSYDVTIRYPVTLLSENMVPSDWVQVAQCVAADIRAGFDAIVVTHGTDTMPYTLAALSFMLRPIHIPIVFTGSLLPYGEENSDAHQNLWDALKFAAEHAYAGVYLVFQSELNKQRYEKVHREVYWGSRVQSIRAGGKSFETVDNRPLFRIVDGLIKGNDPFKISKKKVGKIEVDSRLDEGVEVFKVYPGFNPKLLEEVVNRGTKAVIIDLYHSGTACAREGKYSRYSIVNSVKYLVENKVAVLGAGAPFRAHEQYQSTSSLVDAGLHPLGRMSLEATVVKAMCLIGRDFNSESLCKAMDKPLMKEIFTGGAYD